MALSFPFFIGSAGFLWGVKSLGSFDTFGKEPILNYLLDKEPPEPMPFTIKGPYRWVRHPLYTSCLLMIWSCPDITLDRLIHNIIWTVWIVIGSILEERDLASTFEDEYKEYQSKVPMLIPRSFSPLH